MTETVWYFARRYPGSGRFAGTLCRRDHRYVPPAEPDHVGAFVGPDCAHPATDGGLIPADEEDLFYQTCAWQEHDACHARRVPGCRWCAEGPA